MKGIKIAVSVAVHHKTKGIRKGIGRLRDGTSKSSQLPTVLPGEWKWHDEKVR